MNISWRKFIETKRENPEPQPLLLEALSYVSERGRVLDIGAGALIDSEHLLKEGFAQVVAIDPEIATKELAGSMQDTRFSYSDTTIEEYTFPHTTFDLVSAQFVLSYMSRESIEYVVAEVHKSLKHGSIFAGQLFGDRDSWNVEGDYRTYYTKEEAETLLAPFETLVFREKEEGTISRLGKPKHSHVFEFIVRKVA